MTKQKRNFLIYSLNGGMFRADEALGDDRPLTEEDLLSEVFKHKTIDEISYTKILKDSIDSIPNKEDIRVYFASGNDEVWNYNPIMSAYIGELVYSSVLVFVGENEMDGYYENPKMDNDLFLQIVSRFIQTCTQYLYETIGENNVAEGETADTGDRPNQTQTSKKSPMFKLSKIKYNITSLLSEDNPIVRPGKNKQRLDEYWSKNYIGKYHPDFVFNNLLSIDEDSQEVSKAYVMMKPGLMTLYLMDTGRADIFFTQYYTDLFKKAIDDMEESVKDLGSDAKEEEIQEAKDKVLQRLYS